MTSQLNKPFFGLFDGFSFLCNFKFASLARLVLQQRWNVSIIAQLFLCYIELSLLAIASLALTAVWKTGEI